MGGLQDQPRPDTMSKSEVPGHGTLALLLAGMAPLFTTGMASFLVAGMAPLLMAGVASFLRPAWPPFHDRHGLLFTAGMASLLAASMAPLFMTGMATFSTSVGDGGGRVAAT